MNSQGIQQANISTKTFLSSELSILCILLNKNEWASPLFIGLRELVILALKSHFRS